MGYTRLTAKKKLSDFPCSNEFQFSENIFKHSRFLHVSLSRHTMRALNHWSWRRQRQCSWNREWIKDHEVITADWYYQEPKQIRLFFRQISQQLRTVWKFHHATVLAKPMLFSQQIFGSNWCLKYTFWATHPVETLIRRSRLLRCYAPLVGRFELLSLNSLTDWINVSNSVAKGATIAFILRSTSLEDNLRSSNCDCKLSHLL